MLASSALYFAILALKFSKFCPFSVPVAVALTGFTFLESAVGFEFGDKTFEFGDFLAQFAGFTQTRIETSVVSLHHSFLAARYRSASIAAAQPIPAAVTAWR